MRLIIVALGMVVAAGGASALGTGGYQGGGQGFDLAPAEEAGAGYGYGLGYGVWADPATGNVNVHQDYNENVCHCTPPTTGPEVGFDVNTGRWLDVNANALEGRADVNSNGGGWVNTPGPSEGGLANQGFGLVDLRAHADKDGHVQVFGGNTVGGSAVQHHAYFCVNGDSANVPYGSGVSLDLNGFPANVGNGQCFKPEP